MDSDDDSDGVSRASSSDHDFYGDGLMDDFCCDFNQFTGV